MCNPTKLPRKASPSASSPSSSPAAGMLPPSPASTSASSGMPSLSSSSSRGNPTKNHRNTNNDKAGSSASESSPGLAILSSPPRDSLLHRIRRSRAGQESCDDIQRHPQHQWGHSESSVLPTVEVGGTAEITPSFRHPREFIPAQDEEDEIPGLIDEDRDHDLHSPETDADAFNSWRQQRRKQSLPSQQQQRRRLFPRESRPKPPPRDSGGALPFFVLDWMLEDLIPDHQNAQDLAKLLNEQQTHDEQQQSKKNKKKGLHSFPPLRKSKSCGLVGSSKSWSLSPDPSPIIQRFLPWSQWKTTTEEEEDDETMQSKDDLNHPPCRAIEPRTTIPTTFHQPASPIPSGGSDTATSKATTTTTSIPPMPVTPKSSNRKNCKMRQKLMRQRRECLISRRQRGGGDVDADMDMDVEMDIDVDVDGDLEDLLIPRILNKTLEDEAKEATTTNASSETHTSLKLTPRTTSSASNKGNSEDHRQTKGGNSWMGKSSTKKSASCPQFYKDDDDDSSNPTSQKAIQLRKRAKEQIERRERRNKLTIVQRSLTLAQGWNNKGLSMAGMATRAEQQQQQADAITSISNESTTVITSVTDADSSKGEAQHGAERWWESSLECWDNALEIYRSLLGEYHERVADVQNNRGIALGKLGRFEEALRTLGMALEARKKQGQRVMECYSQGTQRSTTDAASGNSRAEAAAAAIASTLHNIANVFRDAGNPCEALKVLVEAQNTLLASIREISFGDHRHHCWHQSARLSTAIGHVYSESQSWMDARDAYGEALDVYERLSRSLSRLSDRLGSGRQPPKQNPQHGTLSFEDPEEAQRLELLHHQQLIQREVSVLEEDLDELDRCQQARDGSRARLLQVRREQQHQKHRHDAPRHRPRQQHPQQQQQQQQQQNTLFGIVSNLRA